MATITKIEIDGFKAFPNNFSIDLPDGKNLLIYGENGSGKSSLYYALHVLMQSVFKDDKGAKYFKPGDTNGDEFIPNNEQLININRFDEAKVNTYTPNIRITFDDGKVWRLDNGGLQSENGGDDSEIRMLNKDSAFINHSYISRFHAARNSEEINLWNVFYKDILPFHLPAGTSEFLADLYDNIKREYNGGIDIKNKAFQDQITKFNDLLDKYINRINIRINSIYNDNFKNEGDKDLNIKLIYYSKDHPDNVLKEQYYLFCEKNTNGANMLYPPKIGIEIKEAGLLIYKPQSYFNEAKLTAIALAVRFAAMSTTAITSGSFLALDDMLISLDMSNRAKVVLFLLGISDKYKIYLFTHDKAFYNYVTHIISQKGKSSDWTFKRISYNYTKKQPMILDDSCEYLSKAKYFYDLGDYETSAIYFRKTLEQNIGERLPFELKTRVDGGFLELQTLWDKFIKFYAHNGTPIDREMQKIFSASKLLILNPAAHFQRLANPIYKSELDEIFKLINYICRLSKIEKQLILEQGKTLVFQHPKENYNCSFILDDDLVIIEGEHIVAKIPKCKNIKWEYNGVEYWNFELKKRDLENPLIVATPKLTNFIDNMINKVPLNITQKMFIENCKVDGISLLEFMGNIDLLRISVKI